MKEAADRMRERILAGARRQVFTAGLLRTGVDDVASAAGVTKRTLYRYFPSKDALVEAVFDDLMREGEAAFTSALTAPGTVRDRLRRVFELLAAQARAQSPLLHAEMAKTYPALHLRLLRFRQDRLRSLTAVLEEARARGDVRPEVLPDVAVAMLVAAVDFVVDGERVLASGRSLPETIGTVLAVFESGVLAANAPRATRAKRPARRKS